MKKRYSKILSLIAYMILIVTVLCTGIASAEEKNADIQGKPFPDFTATDTEGNVFTLSEALKSHEAVLINFWATWCGPCQNEFPFLNEAYEKYRDKVAFIAISTEKKDTMEKIEAYRKEHNISFPMGRYTDEKMEEYVDTTGIPVTVIVDRFGNVVFVHNGALSSTGSVERVLDTFLGDGYTASSVLKEIPKDTSTHGYPVSASRAVYPESGNYRKLYVRSDQKPNPITGYIIQDKSVRLRIEIGPEDDAAGMGLVNMLYGEVKPVASLLDPDRGVYVYDVEMPDASDSVHHMVIALYDGSANDDPKELGVYLFTDEETVKELVAESNAEGPDKYTWEYVDEEKKAENKAQAYIVHVLDQDGKPVEGVTMNFCTDTACVPKESDENGLITFTGAPDAYHVSIVDVPDGYSCDEKYEMTTAREYGEWVLRVKKD